MIIARELEYLFAKPGAKKWLTRNRSQRPNALFPTGFKVGENVKKGTSDFVYSLDRSALTLKERLDARMTAEFPVDLLANGFAGETAVGAPWHNLRNASGIGMNPLPIPISNNADLIAANNLASQIRPKDLPWLHAIMDGFFGHVAPANLYIRKDGSTSFPFFTPDIKYKKGWTYKAFRNVEDFLNKAVGGRNDLRAWLSEYHAMYLYAIHERQQPNAITLDNGVYSSKPRTAPTPQEARSGSYAGSTYADMSIRDRNGNIIEGHFRMRRRDVFGANGIANYFLTGIIGCFRAVYLEKFAFTFKHRDRHDKARKSAPYRFIIGSDVKTMDKMCPAWFAEAVFDRLNKYLDERVVIMMKRLFAAPYVCPPPWTDLKGPDDPRLKDYEPVFGGDPMDPENLKQNVGLPSGVAFNPDWGKLWMTFVYVILYRDCGAISNVSDIEPLLRGENRQHALLDMSDDAVFLTNSEAVAMKFQSPSSPYAVLEVERPVIFLGDVFIESGGKRDVVPNPLTFLVNMLCREDSVDRIDPRVWAASYLARYQVYSPTPIFRDMNRIFEEEARSALGFSPLLLARQLSKLQKFEDADALFREDPRVIYYKIDPKDVSPALLDEKIATIPAADFFDDIKHLFKVPTVNYEEVA